MIIESIISVNRTKSRVLCRNAGNPALADFILSNRAVLDLDLREGQETDPETEAGILAALRKECLSACGNLLKLQDYTAARLRQKLKQAGFPDEVTGQCLKEMEDARYLDDSRYAEHFIEAHRTDRSLKRIREDLRSRGVPEDVIRAALENTAGEAYDGADDPEEKQIRDFLEKKRYDPETAGYEEKMKLMAALYRRGYRTELIRKVLGTYD